jgi:hypothetical protein
MNHARRTASRQVRRRKVECSLSRVQLKLDATFLNALTAVARFIALAIVVPSFAMAVKSANYARTSLSIH